MMENLITALMQRMGINPQEFLDGLQQFIANVYARLDEYDTRMKAQEALLSDIHAAVVLKSREYVERAGEGANGSTGTVDPTLSQLTITFAGNEVRQ